jgi:hypothetical protein
MDDDQYSPDEVKRRLQKMLRGAFSGPPTTLKDIPKKAGESGAPRAGSASSATADNIGTTCYVCFFNFRLKIPAWQRTV